MDLCFHLDLCHRLDLETSGVLLLGKTLSLKRPPSAAQLAAGAPDPRAEAVRRFSAAVDMRRRILITAESRARAVHEACLAAGLTETGKFGIEKGSGYVHTQAKKVATLGRRLTRKVLPF